MTFLFPVLATSSLRPGMAMTAYKDTLQVIPSRGQRNEAKRQNDAVNNVVDDAQNAKHT